MFALSSHPMLGRLGKIVMFAAIAFAIADYAETISQLIQAAVTGGDDKLASVAATVRPIKMILFLVTFLGLLIGLAIRRMTARAA